MLPGSLSLGHRPTCPAPVSEDGASVVLAYGMPRFCMLFSDPTKAEITTLEEERVDLALLNERNSGVLILEGRQRSMRPLFLKTPFHDGLKRIVDFTQFDVAGLETGEHKSLALVLQDQAGIVRVIRLLRMPRQFCEAMSSRGKRPRNGTPASTPSMTRRCDAASSATPRPSRTSARRR